MTKITTQMVVDYILNYAKLHNGEAPYNWRVMVEFIDDSERQSRELLKGLLTRLFIIQRDPSADKSLCQAEIKLYGEALADLGIKGVIRK